MNSLHLVDHDLLPMIETIAMNTFTVEGLPEIRANSEKAFALLGTPEIAGQIRQVQGPGKTLELYIFDPQPGAKHRPALYYIHGGGMIVGSASGMQAIPSRLAASLGIVVISVEYRLAPEAPFPAPQQDCLAGLAWLAENAGELGVDPDRIAVVGDSAGGGLAAATAQMARDTNGPKLAGQFLIYPMLDHRTGGAQCSYRNGHTGEFIWNRQSNQFGWECLRGDYQADDSRKGWFSPSLASDLTRLPPTWIGVGSLDLFLDEDFDYARRLVDAGVPVEMHCYPGAIHGFDMMAHTAIAQAFHNDLLAAIRRILGLG